MKTSNSNCTPMNLKLSLLSILCAYLSVGCPGWAGAKTNCTAAPSGLVSWWPGDGFALDVAGTNNGTLQGGAAYSAGEVGQAFSLDGTNGFVSTSLLITNPQTFT